MKAVLLLLMIAGALVAQEVTPSPSATTHPSQNKELPLPQEGEKSGPELLPEVNAIPDILPIKGNAVPKKPRVLTPEEQKRFEEIRNQAIQSPRALAMLSKANSAMTIEAKRVYMDAYIVLVCLKMRELEPDFAEPIRSYQRREIHKIFKK
jgi:hypothetical protein